MQNGPTYNYLGYTQDHPVNSKKQKHLNVLYAGLSCIKPLGLYAGQKHNEPKKGKGKASSLDIAPLTILNSGALQPRKWQLTGND